MLNRARITIAAPGTVPECETGELFTFSAEPPAPGWKGFTIHFPENGPPLYGWRKSAEPTDGRKEMLQAA